MKYLLLAATIVALSLTACDQFKEHKPGEGKPGQYPPSLWDKRDSAPPAAEDDVAGDAEQRHAEPAE